MIRKIIGAFFLFLISHSFQAQNIKFGKIEDEVVLEKMSINFPEADAVLLYRSSKSYYDLESNKWIIKTRVHERIKIYTKEGFDYATKKIKLHKYDRGPEKIDIKGLTYYLDGAKIKKAQLRNDQIFSENVHDYLRKENFTMPSVQEGCVVEWVYTITSPYISLIPEAEFQSDIPAEYIEAEVAIPDEFVYRYVQSGYTEVDVREEVRSRMIIYENKSAVEVITNRNASSKGHVRSVKFKVNDRIFHGTATMVDALKEEPCTKNIDNYKSKAIFELIAHQPANEAATNYAKTWDDVTFRIYESSKFGQQIGENEYYLDDLNEIIENCNSDNEKMLSVFHFVKNRMNWDGYNSTLASRKLKKSYEEKVGNVAEINLILVSMLKNAGLTSNPVLLSTRAHGVSIFPTNDGFNYVIASVQLNDKLVLLDATDPFSMPDVLPLRDINWYGRLVMENGASEFVELTPSNRSNKTSFINVNFESEEEISGNIAQTMTGHFAKNFREEFHNVDSTEIYKILKKENDRISNLKNLEIQNLEDENKQVIMSYDYDSNFHLEKSGDEIYFGPFSTESELVSPFKSKNRIYPVNFEFPMEDKLISNITIPDGYQVSFKPEDFSIVMPEEIISYKYICNVSGNQIQALSQFRINKTMVTPELYDALRDFYRKMIEKQNEKIILKKNQ